MVPENRNRKDQARNDSEGPAGLPWFQLDRVWAAWRIEPVLKDISWCWQAGQQWAVLGPNGAGKTALAQLLAGRLQPSRGRLVRHPQFASDNAIVWTSFERQRQLIEREQRLDQSELRSDAFDPGTLVADFILANGAADMTYRQLIRDCGIEHLTQQGLRFLSTGEARKVMLAAALWQRPALIIMDNPYAGLDQAAQRQLAAMVNHYQTKGQTILLLLQDSRQISLATTHVLALDQGQVDYCGPRAGYQTPPTRTPHAPVRLPDPLPRNYRLDRHQPLFTLEQVSARYGQKPVLTDINWTLHWGDQVHLRGPNGAGKTTLLSMLYGDSHQAYGQQITLFGRARGSGESVAELKQKFGLVSTALHLQYNRRLSVADLVGSGLFDTVGLYRQPGPGERQHILHWLRTVGLEALAGSPFQQLSFGQQRLALLARAMVKSPPILILDEPGIGLDPAQQAFILELAGSIAQQGETQIIFVSHEREKSPPFINRTVTLVSHKNSGYTALIS